ncbi:hypothetical protein J2X31_003607 [Flavobacterium arsenatis]|uniref:Uncharacterized protein n=1 Tax=Flavobacterium arsenatis TaxID=1484332 RepID=A0ABU1TUL4_9FLAO|nr:hypothetical protein [Flavobacterium arsenatis]MDR6969574.1 hypothetical protein [Flavobacterium arsenatis]
MEQQPYTPPQAGQELNKHQQSKPNRKRKIIIWIIIGISVLIGASTFAFFYGINKARQSYYFGPDQEGYPVDSVYVDGWASPEDYANWKNATFTIPEYNDIPIAFKRGIVKIFLNNGYLGNDSDNSDIYFFTKIKDRAHKVIAYGDFTGQGEREMVFLLENSDFQSSAIFIISQNGNLLYWKKNSYELPTIKSFKKGTPIYMDEMKLIPAPNDGIIKQTKNSKYVLIYNHKTKTFDDYYQFTKYEIENMETITEDHEYEEMEEPSDTITK